MVKAAVQKLMMEHSPQDKDRLVQDQQHNSVTTEALQKASYCLQVCITFRAKSKVEEFLVSFSYDCDINITICD